MDDARTVLDIETAGATLTMNMRRNEVIGIHIRGDAAADYALDVSDRQGNWMQAAETFSGTDINYGGFEPAQHVRLRVTTGTATAGDSADVMLTAAGR